MPQDDTTSLANVIRNEADTGRRNLALALFGALSGVGLLEACAADQGGATLEPIEQASSALSGGNVIQFDTLANLRATSGTATDQCAILENRSAPASSTSPPDGGGGIFCWTPDTTTADNDGTVIAKSTGRTGAWKRIFADAVDVRWFGAVGDDLQASAAANYSAFFNALVSLPVSGGKIIVPPGVFWLSNIFVIDKPKVTLVGSGRETSTLKIDPSAGGPNRVIAINSPASDVIIRDLSITHATLSGSTLPGTGFSALAINGASRTIVENVYIHDIYTSAFGTGQSPADCIFRGCLVDRCYEHGWYIGSSTDLLVEGCKVKDTMWQAAGGPTNTYGSACAFKISYDNPGLRISNSVADLGYASCAGFGAESSNLGKILVNNCIVYLRNSNQFGFSSSAEGPVLFSNMVVDVGPGYGSGTGAAIGAYIYGSSTSNRGHSTTVNNVHFMGTYSSIVLMLGTCRDVRLIDVTIDNGPTVSGVYAIELGDTIRPWVQGCRIESGLLGINVGSTVGARLLQNRVNVSSTKYNLILGPTDYFIDDLEPRKIVLSNGSTAAFEDENFRGVVHVFDASGYYGMFAIRGKNSHYVRLLLNPDSAYSDAATTPSRINLYWNAGGWYEIQNNSGGAATLSVRSERVQEA